MSDCRKTIAVFLIACATLAPLRFVEAQSQGAPPQQIPKPTPEPDEQDSVVRISTQLVQIDAVITDKKGEHVMDVKEDEVELLIDGKKQPLTFFKLIKVPVKEREPEPNKRDKATTASTNSVVTPPNLSGRTIAPEKVARTMAFIVDDLSLSFESTHYTREALKKFVTQQMEEGDLVGIIRTGRGLGALQQFTSDKRLLLTAIDRLTWNPFARSMMPKFGVGGANGVTANPNESEEERLARQASQDRQDDFRDTVFSTGTLGAVNFVVRGLRELPGRKMAVLISDGITLFTRDGDQNQQVVENVRRLVDQANRSSVVIYSLDARGLQTLSPTAADDLSGMSQQQMQEQREQVTQAFGDSQDGLSYLARETGGFAILNNNDLNFGVRKVLKDNENYYLLGFDPDDASFDRKYHNIRLRMTRAGLTARSRKGFFGIPDTAPRQLSKTTPKTRDEQILNALYSPFGARDFTLRMTSVFFNVDNPPAMAATTKPDATVKPKPAPKKDKENKMPEGTLTFVRSMLHLEADQFTVTTAPDGKREMKLELVAFAFNEQGAITDQVGRSFEMSYTEEEYQRILRDGLVYTSNIALKQPGAYQFRIVARDPATGKLGSAGQFIQIPDLKKKRLAMSGIVLAGTPKGTNNVAAALAAPAQGEAQSEQRRQRELAMTLRRLPRNAVLDYAFHVYNAALNPATKQPQLISFTELYQNGKRIHQGQERPVALGENVTAQRVACFGQMSFDNMAAGEYALRVVVKDQAANRKYAQVEQWIDFTVN